MGNNIGGLDSVNTDKRSDFVTPEIRYMEGPINNFLYNEFQKKFPAMQQSRKPSPKLDNSITGFEKSLELSVSNPRTKFVSKRDSSITELLSQEVQAREEKEIASPDIVSPLESSLPKALYMRTSGEYDLNSQDSK